MVATKAYCDVESYYNVSFSNEAESRKIISILPIRTGKAHISLRNRAYVHTSIYEISSLLQDSQARRGGGSYVI